ncbi:MAG: endolytic transglycosylase MltG [Clostridiales bacterium]|nr:endolytic transglycosylase MltG [Clostridiales bacterium]
MKRSFIVLILMVFLVACGHEEKEKPPVETTSMAAESESESPEQSETSSIAEESSIESSPEEERPETYTEESSVEDIEESVLTEIDTTETWAGKRYMDIIDDLGVIPEGMTNLLPEEAAGCPYPLEGYLLPMQYAVDEEILKLPQLVDQSLAVLDTCMAEADTDMSLHEVLTRASIVQIEAMRGGESEIAYPEVMPQIASVIENRLADGTPLQMDVTYRYAQFLIETAGLSEEDALAYDTYEASALPPGPICMPSVEAVQAVLHPAETDDFFFVYDVDGNYYFAATYDEHLANCEKAGIY